MVKRIFFLGGALFRYARGENWAGRAIWAWLKTIARAVRISL